MESPLAYPESPLDLDEASYPCKGCGEVRRRRRQFRQTTVNFCDRSWRRARPLNLVCFVSASYPLVVLTDPAGNRWHIDCFRCNTCSTLLDSDANLLLLGDGSLICNNCTYSCSNCGNKIEDLAILTGDQAFCANCFKCRNCKKKIENLRYARTSQGIFCMDCHEALMARRRKKTARNTGQRQKVPSNNNAHLDKSLPAIPPPEARKTLYSTTTETPPSETSESMQMPSVRMPAQEEQRHQLAERRDPSPASQNYVKGIAPYPRNMS
jgi:Rho-type GTPase-activating protein 1/2